jgi:hypothetical protein
MVLRLWRFFFRPNVGFRRELSLIVGSCRRAAVDADAVLREYYAGVLRRIF